MKKYIKRTLKEPIEQATKSFKVILLTGPRQVGKTTLLKEIAKNNRSYVTLDDQNMRIAAKNDPAMFLDRLNLPVLIDEVQYAPELFSYIKMIVDESDQRGLFWLTGSQQFEMMENITESLTGRVGVFKLQGLSLEEEEQYPSHGPFLPTIEVLKKRKSSRKKALGIKEIYHKIWLGSFPDVVTNNGEFWERFYESYITTYIQKDIRNHLRVADEAVFRRFMEVAAARTGQLLNYHDISKDTGISEPTVKKWLQALEASGIIYLLQPYSNNEANRLIKTPKLYFMDTGLCCYLSGWLNPEVLERGAMSGAILETYAVSEIIKSYLHHGRIPRIYFYRDKEQREIDLLIEENGTIYPIEIKKSAKIGDKTFSGFSVLENLNIKLGHGAVLSFVKDLIPIEKDIDAVPVSFI